MLTRFFKVLPWVDDSLQRPLRTESFLMLQNIVKPFSASQTKVTGCLMESLFRAAKLPGGLTRFSKALQIL